MKDQDPKIVVITPVRNEAWILDRFLSVTSQFADQIIIADQNSTDDSLEICKRYSKVNLVRNESDSFNEADRQILLIQKARDLVPEHKILLALDADEILAANAIQTCGWQTMLKAKPGTVLYFEKPDLFGSPSKAIRYENPWPLGYVDDGAEHNPKKIHSIRIPQPDHSPRLYIHDVKILHYGLTRLDAQNSKRRFYVVIEKILKNKNLFLRRSQYLPNFNYIQLGKLDKSPKEWFRAWEEIGIDMFSIYHSTYYWQDLEVLKYFNQYGASKFWFENIWDCDWEACLAYANSLNIDDVSKLSVRRPPQVILFVMNFLDTIYTRIVRVKFLFR